MVPASVQHNLEMVRCKIAAACDQYGRRSEDVNLLAVTKTVDVARIRAAMGAGQRDFGENYLQEACEKIAEVDDPSVVWHYIGAIQSNKTAEIARRFGWVHTVARAKIAARLAAQRPADLPPLKVMVQVNISGERTKAGVAAGEAGSLIEQLLSLPRLEIRGLMAIPAPTSDFGAQRAGYRRLRELHGEIQAQFGAALPHFVDLSMGMSGDMEAAIAEGATWLRIGTAIFGPRQRQD